MRDKVTTPAIQARKDGPKVTVVTAYDAPSARIAERASADIILVGDSLATVVLGYENTLSVTIDVMIHHTAAVARTKPSALLVVDMPWLSYHLSVEETIRNAGRLLSEGGAEAVKLEGGRKRLPMIGALLATEIPVMGHLGLTPQSIHTMGGYRVQGKQTDAARELVADARALADAGVFAIVLEGIPDALAQIITQEVSVPTIGIGAGPHCDGQVLVFHDVLGLYDGHRPKFVRQYAHLADAATEGLQRFFADIQAGTFPSDAESYHMDKQVAQTLQSLKGERESDHA
ncbi:MAG: 3-methyl-2-oxobutanoate hydroxymethyltransferase [Chloroflexi bacterium]|nr:3-methyl-2-oxobutanoate hydroxymethyltransferase [Ktedonobacteraceae bacterium]MBV8822655.1 3-methyl-2-oxobutanoate hydroxymethyltransferase [Ktedonobacteraceae bacterium]MBV9019483.1 3-methyl-2-oxobutanoate hydroxymethyltransferase [Ktedonobacteraceae bacterium]MBV9706130.1 3-methyl-2-oxobutanoate hydroxymethyltransferase [Chloroflexota bacterium]